MEDATLEKFFGRNFSYSNKKIKIYHRLQRDPLSPFKGGNLADIFFYAAMLGFRDERSEPLSDPRPNIWLNAFGSRRVAILTAMVISKAGSVDALFGPEKAKTVLEEYANAGIDMIEGDLLGGAGAEPIERMSFRMKNILDQRAAPESEPGQEPL